MDTKNILEKNVNNSKYILTKYYVVYCILVGNITYCALYDYLS